MSSGDEWAEAFHALAGGDKRVAPDVVREFLREEQDLGEEEVTQAKFEALLLQAGGESAVTHGLKRADFARFCDLVAAHVEGATLGGGNAAAGERDGHAAPHAAPHPPSAAPNLDFVNEMHDLAEDEIRESFDRLCQGYADCVPLASFLAHLREEQDIEASELSDAAVENAARQAGAGPGGEMGWESFVRLSRAVARMVEDVDAGAGGGATEQGGAVEQGSAAEAALSQELGRQSHFDFVNHMAGGAQDGRVVPQLSLPEPTPPSSREVEIARGILEKLRRRAVPKVQAIWFLQRYNTREWLVAHKLNLKPALARRQLNVDATCALLAAYVKSYSS